MLFQGISAGSVLHFSFLYFLLKVNSETNWAVEVMLVTSIAILNFTDTHDGFCEVCGNAGLVREYLELSEQLKKGLPEFDNQKV